MILASNQNQKKKHHQQQQKKRRKWGEKLKIINRMKVFRNSIVCALCIVLIKANATQTVHSSMACLVNSAPREWEETSLEIDNHRSMHSAAAAAATCKFFAILKSSGWCLLEKGRSFRYPLHGDGKLKACFENKVLF